MLTYYSVLSWSSTCIQHIEPEDSLSRRIKQLCLLISYKMNFMALRFTTLMKTWQDLAFLAITR